MSATDKYPALMAYIAKHEGLSSARWCDALHCDELRAQEGELADVVHDLARAQADYAAEASARGQSPFPYNAAMGEFLGLPLKGNHEPTHGYYMATQLLAHYRYGEAKRAILALISEGRTLRIVTARSKKDRAPVRFASFTGAGQIRIDGNAVQLDNGKQKARIASNWSVETALSRVAEALRTGQAYGA